jgi:hypothetical protein
MAKRRRIEAGVKAKVALAAVRGDRATSQLVSAFNDRRDKGAAGMGTCEQQEVRMDPFRGPGDADQHALWSADARQPGRIAGVGLEETGVVFSAPKIRVATACTCWCKPGKSLGFRISTEPTSRFKSPVASLSVALICEIERCRPRALQRRRQNRRFLLRQAERKRPRNSIRDCHLRSGGHGA